MNMTLSLLCAFTALASDDVFWEILTALDRHNMACTHVSLATAVDDRVSATSKPHLPLSPRQRLYLAPSELERVHAEISRTTSYLQNSQWYELIVQATNMHRAKFRKLLELTWRRQAPPDALSQAFGNAYSSETYISDSPMVRVQVLPNAEIETVITIGGLYMTVTSGNNFHKGFISPRWRYDLFPELGPPHSLALGVAIMKLFKVTCMSIIEAHGVDVESPIAAAIRMGKLT